MATNPPKSADQQSNKHQNSVFKTGESNQYLFEDDTSITIDSPHPLFNIDVMETYDTFLDELDRNKTAETFKNEYDGIDVLCFKAKQAITAVLDVNEFEQQGIERTTTGMGSITTFSTYHEFAVAWFQQFINEYNMVLHDETPEGFTTLHKSVIELDENEGVTAETILSTVAETLNVEITIE